MAMAGSCVSSVCRNVVPLLGSPVMKTGCRIGRERMAGSFSSMRSKRSRFFERPHDIEADGAAAECAEVGFRIVGPHQPVQRVDEGAIGKVFPPRACQGRRDHLLGVEGGALAATDCARLQFTEARHAQRVPHSKQKVNYPSPKQLLRAPGEPGPNGPNRRAPVEPANAYEPLSTARQCKIGVRGRCEVRASIPKKSKICTIAKRRSGRTAKILPNFHPDARSRPRKRCG